MKNVRGAKSWRKGCKIWFEISIKIATAILILQMMPWKIETCKTQLKFIKKAHAGHDTNWIKLR